MVDFEYKNTNKYGEELFISNESGIRIKLSRLYWLTDDDENDGTVYMEISPVGTAGFPAVMDFRLEPEQVDELITHLYNVRNGTNFGGNNEPDS